MFPLGHPIVPHAGIPLHVFEQRYRRLMRDCMDGDRRFGIVMIERGSEVGGGDVRTSIGTLVEIADADELPDGRWLLIAVGIRRLRVVEWLPDDPYPRALVEELADPPVAAGGEIRDDLERSIRRIAALQSELGDPAPPIDVDLADDPVAAGYQAAALASLSALDLQRLIEIEDPDRRLTEIAAALRETEEVLRLRIRG
jgi:Lon protease-like protein